MNSKGFQPTPVQYLGGIFPVKHRGSLLVVESEWFERREKERLTIVMPLLKLGVRIAEEHDCTVSQALDKIQDLGKPGADMSLFAGYMAELDEIFAANFSEVQYRKELALLVLNTRVSKKWLADNYDVIQEEFDYIPFDTDPDTLHYVWTSEGVSRLPVSLLEAATDFLLAEQNGGKPSTSVPSETSPVGADEVTIAKKPSSPSRTRSGKKA